MNCITIPVKDVNGNYVQPELADIRGTSMEEKPVGFADGSTFFETDTHKFYTYSADSETWEEF